MNDDFQEFLEALARAGADFIIVGAHALAVHGVPRATGDLDVWIRSDRENARRVWAALLEFGAPLASLNITEQDLEQPETVVQVGLPPRRIDILTTITAVDFSAAWAHRVHQSVEGVEVAFLGREDLLKNKRATGRTKDLADVETLERSGDGTEA